MDHGDSAKAESMVSSKNCPRAHGDLVWFRACTINGTFSLGLQGMPLSEHALMYSEDYILCHSRYMSPP